MTTAMNVFQSSMTHALIQALGWTLIHFLWQGALVAVVLWCALALMEHRSADARYAAALLALVSMLVLPVLTFVHLAGEEYSLAATNTVWINAGSTVISADAGAGSGSWSSYMTSQLDHLMPCLMLVWFAGALVFSCRLVVGIAVAHGWKLQGVQDAPARLQIAFDNLRTRLGVRFAARLVESAKVHVPTVIGWMKPVVLLPAGCLTGMSEQQIEALLAHELAHICRNDYLVSVIQSVLEALLFYHPAVWWVSSRLRREREYCCDEMAVGVCGDRLAYARALSLLEERRALLPEMALGANGGVLTMRIKRLLGYRQEIASSNMVWVIVLVVVIAGGGSIAGRFALAEPKAPLSSSESMTQAGQDTEAAAQAVVAENERNIAEVESQTEKAAEQSRAAERQLAEAQEELAQVTKDAYAQTADQSQNRLDDSQKKQLADAQKQVQAALKKLNSAEFKEHLKAVQQQIENLNSPEFKKRLDDAAAAAAAASAKVNSPEFRKQLEDAQKRMQEKLSSPEFKKQFEDMQKRLQDSKELQDKIQAKLDSPEFKKQIADAQKQAQKFNSPEFRKKMEDMQRHMQDEMQKKFNSPEFKRQLEDAQKQAEKFNTPEFRERIRDMQKQTQDEMQKFNSPEYREKIRKMMKDAEKNGAHANFNSGGLFAQNTLPSAAPRVAPATPTSPAAPPTSVAVAPAAAPVPPAAPTPAPSERNDADVSVRTNIQVKGNVMAGQAISQPPPVYPKEAREAHIEGTVVLKAVIGKTGNVERLSVVSGPTELTRSAIDAVRQWHYKPYLLNGQPVEVETTINVNYSLGDGSSADPGPQAGNYTPPQLIYKVEPEFTPEARAAKMAGIVVVNMDVTQQGLPSNVHVVRSLNLALDQKALEAVSQYRFKPAIREGRAVSVPVNVEVNFQLR